MVLSYAGLMGLLDGLIVLPALYGGAGPHPTPKNIV